MTDNSTFNCTVCGAPNYSEAGKSQMACTYCGTNIVIPDKLRIKAIPKAEPAKLKEKPVPRPEKEAADLLRKAQPVAIKAWNLYAYWTWIRWLMPTCLVILLISIVVCVALGAVPIFINMLR
jgi:DNA-directed RNA polymerase subunit RPC12/RpoP